MKKFALSIFVSLIFVATQIESYFVRGSIYKKNGQYIVLLADLHKPSDFSKTQHNQLIESLKSFKAHSFITLVEDLRSDAVYKDNKRYQSAHKFVCSKFDYESLSPLSFLHSKLIQEKIPVKNVECRHAELTLFDEVNFTVFPIERTPKLSIEDVVSEIKKNIIKFKKHTSKIKKTLEKEEKEASTTCNLLQDTLEFFLDQYAQYLKQPEINLMGLCNAINSNLISNINLIDAKILYNLFSRSTDKNLIVICAGYCHTMKTEKLLDTIGYTLTKETGASLPRNCDNAVSISSEMAFDPDPIDVEIFFKMLPNM